MAALDFGMALAKGLVIPNRIEQERVIAEAGGRNIFKSEDWWNKQYDKSVQAELQESKTAKAQGYILDNKFTPFTSVSSLRNTPFRDVTPIDMSKGVDAYKQSSFVTRPGMGGSRDIQFRTDIPTGAQLATAKYEAPIFKGMGMSGIWEDTKAALKDVEAQGKASTSKMKRDVATKKSTSKRLKRATGGLVGKVRLPGEAPSTGLPALGEAGLSLTASVFGAEQKL